MRNPGRRPVIVFIGLTMLSLASVGVLSPPASATSSPDAPTIVSSSVSPSGDAYVAFHPGASATPASYTVVASPGGLASSAWYVPSNDPSIAVGYVLGLPTDVVYTFRVIATNEAGDSPPSAPSVAVPAWIGDSVPAPDQAYTLGSQLHPSYSPTDASAVLKVEWFQDGHSLCFREFDPFECGPDEGYPNVFVDTSTLGQHDLVLKVWDTELNVRSHTITYNVFTTSGADTIDPTVSMSTPGVGASYRRGQIVRASYVCGDAPGGTGVASCSGTVANGWAIDTSTPGTHTFSVTARDGAGHTSTTTRSYAVVDDTTPPTVSLVDPAAGAGYTANQAVTPHFSCADEAGGAGLGSCVGVSAQPVGEYSRAGVDTSTNGTHLYTVHAVDAAGNIAVSSHAYLVGSDTTPPGIDLAHPADGETYSLNQLAFASFTCSDNVALVACDGDLGSGSGLSTSTPGTYVFTVQARDSSGLTTTVTHTYYVLDGNLPPQNVPPSGGTFTTDPGGGGATTDTPVQTAISVPSGTSGGTVSVNETSTSQTPPTSYTFFGQQVTISAPPAPDASHPLVLSFTLDASLAPDPAAIEVARDGSLLEDCNATHTNIPCASVPSEVDANGDLTVTVYTDHASTWNFAIHKPFTFSGFAQPVDNPQTLNSVKAGSAIPVKFSLGGNQGLAVLARGFPVSQKVVCSTTAPIDAIEQTVTAGASSLTFSSASSQYTYVWKTDGSWSGTCRVLSVKLADGSVHQALFKFTK